MMKWVTHDSTTLSEFQKLYHAASLKERETNISFALNYSCKGV